MIGETKEQKMDISKIPAANDLAKLTEDFNVVIEIPAESVPVKYEIDKASGAWLVDRFIGTNMRYPANYGFIPHTLCRDGDPLDALVITPYPLVHGSVVRARALGVLRMVDESGDDAKLICVPIDKQCPMYANLQALNDLPSLLLQQIEFFFQNYKGLEKGKWVKLDGYGDLSAAKQEILEAFELAQSL